jgi:hypothetical protein
MLVHMELSRILIRELNDFQVIELREVREAADGGEPLGEPRSFPIVIGLPEAQAIERRLKGVTIKRPQTHDLLANIVEALGASLESISITELAEHTYFATLDMRNAAGELLHIDSRPSDAIALGIAQEVPIYVDDAVIEAAQEPE